MRNYKDLQVWEKAHKLPPRDLPGYVRFPKRRAIRPDQPDPAFVCLDRSKLGGRLWQKIRRRDARSRFQWVWGSELSYHLLLARDFDLLKNTEYFRLNSDLEEVMRMLSSLSQKIRNPLAAQRFQAKS